MWQVLETFRIQTDPATIVQRCRFTRGGVTTLGLALGFHEYGVRTELRCDGFSPDETALFHEAEQKGLPILPTADLKTMLAIPALLVVAYTTHDGIGHVSLVSQLGQDNVTLALEEIEVQSISTLEERRRHDLLETISIYPPVSHKSSDPSTP
jgi:hypothetical protein